MRNYPKSLTTFLSLVLLVSLSFGKDHIITDFGASTDASNNSTEIQAAINACAEIGGRVVIPSGVFRTGGLVLKDNVELYLESGSVLLGSDRKDDYPIHQPTFPSYTNRYQNSALLYAEGRKHITIRGSGTIDGNGGNGDFFLTYKEWRADENGPVRPFGILMRRCENIVIEGVTLQNSAFWMQQYLECKNLRLVNLDIINHANYNNDGVDINNCQDVMISNCRIYCSDDAIAIKSTSDSINKNIVISDCILRTHYNGIKIGTETHGAVQDVVISNCVIGSPGYDNHHGSNNVGYSGIAIQSCDGAGVENILAQNIIIDSMKTPIFIRLQNRGRKIEGLDLPEGPGFIRKVQFRNFTAYGVSKLTSSITGIPGHKVEDVSLVGFRIYTEGGGAEETIHTPVPEAIADYPDVTMFKTNLPAFGLYARHVEGLYVSDFQVVTNEYDARFGVFLEDVEGTRFRDIAFRNDGMDERMEFNRAVSTEDVSR